MSGWPSCLNGSQYFKNFPGGWLVENKRTRYGDASLTYKLTSGNMLSGDVSFGGRIGYSISAHYCSRRCDARSIHVGQVPVDAVRELSWCSLTGCISVTVLERALGCAQEPSCNKRRATIHSGYEVRAARPCSICSRGHVIRAILGLDNSFFFPRILSEEPHYAVNQSAVLVQ